MIISRRCNAFTRMRFGSAILLVVIHLTHTEWLECKYIRLCFYDLWPLLYSLAVRRWRLTFRRYIQGFSKMYGINHHNILPNLILDLCGLLLIVVCQYWVFTFTLGRITYGGHYTTDTVLYISSWVEYFVLVGITILVSGSLSDQIYSYIWISDVQYVVVIIYLRAQY